MGRSIRCRGAQADRTQLNVLVTGATGFVGRHVVAALLSRGHSAVAVVRSRDRARALPWCDRVEFVECDLHAEPHRLFEQSGLPSVLVHLAWPGLPNYKNFFHVAENLPADIRFLEAAVRAGVSQLLVAGTCLEYGLQSGPLDEGMETRPTTSYGLAKDTLRKSMQTLQQSTPFTLQWLRLFYIYGEGQKAGSLLAQLDKVIGSGGTAFDMSRGDQLRDYMGIDEVAATIVRLVENPGCNGVINCASGRPISVRELVENRCAERGAKITLNRGVFAIPDYEPLAFWGVPAKLSKLTADLSGSNPVAR